MANVIIRKGDSLGRTRSEHEKNMRKHWGVQSMSDEQLDKLKYIEKKRKNKWGFHHQFVGLDQVDKLRSHPKTKEEWERSKEEARKRMEKL